MRVTKKRKIEKAEEAFKLATKRANHLIKNATQSERALCQVLDYSGLGYKFQSIIMKGESFYIPDFIFGMLIVEIDGDNHYTQKQMRKDARRTRTLEKWGYKVIRFSNKETIENPKEVFDQIWFFDEAMKQPF